MPLASKIVSGPTALSAAGGTAIAAFGPAAYPPAPACGADCRR